MPLPQLGVGGIGATDLWSENDSDVRGGAREIEVGWQGGEMGSARSGGRRGTRLEPEHGDPP